MATQIRAAEEAVERINGALALGTYSSEPKRERRPLPFSDYAESWLRREVLWRMERGLSGHLAPGTATSYASHVRVHLLPFYAEAALAKIDRGRIQDVHDHCIESGRPKSPRTIEMVIQTLGVLLTHAQTRGDIATNPSRNGKEPAAGGDGAGAPRFRW